MINILNDINTIISMRLNDNNKLEYLDIKIDDLPLLLKTDYSEAYEAYKKGYIIYRGMKDCEKNISISTPKLRMSQNTDNIYTKLFSDILPSWKNYPKRNRSFICSTSKYKASGYAGNNSGLYIVFPKNGSNVGICSSSDLWFSFETVKYYNESNLPRFMHLLIKYISIFCDIHVAPILKMFKQESNSEIIELFNTFDNKILTDNENIDKNIIKDELLLETIISNINNGMGILYSIDKILNPVTNKIYHTNIKSIDTIYSDNCETWTDGTCLFIDYYAIKIPKYI